MPQRDTPTRKSYESGRIGRGAYDYSIEHLYGKKKD